jgi:acetate kinase
MTHVILALNAGSSSIKFSLFALAHEWETLSLLYREELKALATNRIS